MPTGLGVPVGVDSRGAARTITGSDNDDKIIRLALGDDDSENSFQQNIGVGAGMVFSGADEEMRSLVMRRIFDVFRRFEAQLRFRLLTNTIKWTSDSETQETILSFRYVSIESDQEQQFTQTFPNSATSTTGT